ncbi:MAG: arylamine N-acetyltransferase [Roseivivax sp.]|nr:arylamine N-acetyltransferase [Roseivivax sp.]
MTLQPFELRAYLDRLGLASESGVVGLAQMQAAHLDALPFGDIDAFLGRVPDVAPQPVWQKLIATRCDGWCFEQNTLALRALAALDYSATPVMARVVNRDTGLPGPRSHMALIVQAESTEWLFDVGFGGPGAPVPLRLGTGDWQGTHRLRTEGAATVLEMARPDGPAPLYIFDRAPVLPVDIEAANFLAATWPRAPFPGNLMVNKGAGETKTSLLNRRLTQDGRTREIADAADLAHVLAEVFGLNRAQDVPALWARLKA